MPVVPHRVGASGATHETTRGHGGPGLLPHQPTVSADCEGYGDPYGDSGAYGLSEFGYGSPCSGVDASSMYCAAVAEEGIPVSVVSSLPRTDSLRVHTGICWVREDGGQLVTLRSGSDFPAGDYKVQVVIPGTSRRVTAYSGVVGQGEVIHPTLDPSASHLVGSPPTGGQSISFVFPALPVLGEVDVYVTYPSGVEVLLPSEFKCIAYSERSMFAEMRRLSSPILEVESKPPTVSP